MSRRLTQATLVLFALSAGRAAAYEPESKPLGKWERKVGKNTCTLLFEDNRLHITVHGECACTIHADYAVTRDGTVYGVVTSVDMAEDADKEMEAVDMPFSFRFRIDEGMLLLRDFRSPRDGSGKDEVMGRYKRVGPEPVRTVAPVPPPAVAPCWDGTGIRF